MNDSNPHAVDSGNGDEKQERVERGPVVAEIMLYAMMLISSVGLVSFFFVSKETAVRYLVIGALVMTVMTIITVIALARSGIDMKTMKAYPIGLGVFLLIIVVSGIAYHALHS